MQTLSQAQFHLAFAHGEVHSVEIEPKGAQFAVTCLTRTGAAVLVQARKPEPRLFGTVDSAIKLLHKLGVHRVVLSQLDLWRPEQTAQVRRSRPDRAAVFRAAAEYERWVVAKVTASRNDPRPLISDSDWQRIRAAKQVQRKALQSDALPS